MLFCIIIFAEKTAKIKTGLPILLLFKLGIVPIHTWFVLIGSKMNWSILTILITWQKTIPIYLIIYSLKIIALIRAILSIIIGTILQYKNIKRKRLIIYSRISNSCWIIVAILINIQLILIFCTIYFFSVAIIIQIIKIKQLKTTKKRNELIASFLLILILAGIPPSIGFIPKWILFKEFVLNNITTTAFILFFFTTINFYVYLRLFLKTLMKRESNNVIELKNNRFIKFIASFSTIYGIMFLAIFCYAWKRIILIE